MYAVAIGVILWCLAGALLAPFVLSGEISEAERLERGGE